MAVSFKFQALNPENARRYLGKEKGRNLCEFRLDAVS
jgi:hypothetical protein